MWLIYKHTSPSGKVYIGQTRKGVAERWRSGRGYTYNPRTRFSYAIKKYGWDAFLHEIIEDNIESQALANQREKYWISYYNSYDFNYGYNMTIGGDSISLEAIEKAKKAIQVKKRNKLDFIICYELMKFFPNSTIALEWFTDNGYCDKLYKKNPINRVIGQENHTCFGFHFCHIINMFDFKPVGVELINEKKGHRKQIICVDTGDIYDSLTSCSKATGILTQYLSKACKRHSSTQGFYFAYLEEYNELTWEKYQNKKRESKYKKSVYCIDLDKEWDSYISCCKELEIRTSELSRVLTTQNPLYIYKTIRGLHFCFGYEKEYATLGEKRNIRVDSRKVFCVELNQKFNSITEAEKFFKIKNVLKCCRNWKYTSGGYHWCFEEDIKNFCKIEQVDRIFRNGQAKRVVNLTTGEIFDSVSEAARRIERNPTTLSEAIRKNTKCAGCFWSFDNQK